MGEVGEGVPGPGSREEGWGRSGKGSQDQGAGRRGGGFYAKKWDFMLKKREDSDNIFILYFLHFIKQKLGPI